MQNDYFSKKESIFHIWMLEFEEFKEKLLSINELKKIIATFDTNNQHLKEMQQTVLEEEVMYLRNDITQKQDNSDQFKKVAIQS